VVGCSVGGTMTSDSCMLLLRERDLAMIENQVLCCLAKVLCTDRRIVGWHKSKNQKYQKGRFFHGYFDCYCYLLFRILCGHQLLNGEPGIATLDPVNISKRFFDRLIVFLVDTQKKL